MQVSEKFADQNICIIGLGYVGLTLAAAMCDVGYRVHGIERDDRILTALSEGRAHFYENGLDTRIALHVRSGRLTFSSMLERAEHRRVYIITVGTPLTPQKHTNLQSIGVVARSLASVLQAGELVLLRSTVRVGISRDIVKPLLDEAGVPYDLAFCPERTLEGRALEELRSLPQIVGGVDDASALRAKLIFGFLTPTVVLVDSLEAAEMVKLINNTQRDFLFAFANEVAEMCDVLGISASEVIRAGAFNYPRAIGVLPGPVGGPCLEKDPYILAEGVIQSGGTSELILEARRFNEQLPGRSLTRIAEYFLDRKKEPQKLVIFGLAFKGRPETSDLRGSLAYPLVSELRARFPDAEVGGFDPSVDPEEAASFGIRLFTSAEEAARDADAILFQTNNPRFASLDLRWLAEAMAENSIIYDFWMQFAPIELMGGRCYTGLGAWSSTNLGYDERFAAQSAAFTAVGS